MVLEMRKMKDSGIEWIGDIPEGWEVAPVRSCFDEVRTKNTDGQEQNALQFKSGNIISKTNFNANTDDYVADTITNYTVVLPDTVMDFLCKLALQLFLLRGIKVGSFNGI